MVFLKALAVFLGTIIGVGIFGLPFVSSKAGFFVVLAYFLIMGAVAALMNLIYSEVIVGTKKTYRLSGYVEEYLGGRWKKFAFFVVIFSLIGALLAYLIIGGQFLYFCLSPFIGGGVILYTVLFFILGAFLVFKDIKAVAGIELILFCVLVVILALFLTKAFPVIEANNFKAINLGYIFLPYGVVLFSLGAGSIIPEIKEMLHAENKKPEKLKRSLKKVIIWGIAITIIIYILFIYVVQGASSFVAEDAISGLEKALGPQIIKFGFLFGVITCFTSFLTLALTVKKSLWYDFGLNRNLSWLLTCFIPLGLFFLGFRRFINVINFTGAVLFGAEALILVFLYKAFLKKKLNRGMNPLIYLLLELFIMGSLLEIFLFYAKIV